jgi:DNA-directed RNA polymerase specialized sigma24 family protein
MASVAKALETLPADWAEVVKMRFGIGCESRLSPPEIAERLSISPRSVKSLLAHGMQRLHVIVSRSLEVSGAG